MQQARQLTTVMLTLACVVLAAGCGSSKSHAKSTSSRTGATASAGTCDGTSPTVHETDAGIKVIRHCGAASGTVRIGGKTYTVAGGSCGNTAASVVFNVGRTVADGKVSQKRRLAIDYIGILAGRTPVADPGSPPVTKDGTYSRGVLVVGSAGGHVIGMRSVSLTLANGRTTGKWSGVSYDGSHMSGSFSCGG